MVDKAVDVVPPVPAEATSQSPASYLVIATYLPLKGYWKILPFIGLSGKVESQLRASKGIVRYALRTDLPHKCFWTLSVWVDQDDMALFSRSEPHRTAMKKFYEWGTDEAGIAEWSFSDDKIDWKEAEKKLETPTFHYKFEEGKRLVHAPGSKAVIPEEEEDDKDRNRGSE